MIVLPSTMKHHAPARCPRFAIAACAAFVVGFVLTHPATLPAAAPGAEPPAAVAGVAVRVPLPISDSVARRVVQQLRLASTELTTGERPNDARRPILVLEFDPGRTASGRGSEFEDALKVARFLISPSMEGIQTVAYLPRSVEGHAVLAVMACEQIVMAPDTHFGNAGADHDAQHPIDETLVSGYQKIARSRHTVPVAIALAMLDPKDNLLSVETEQGRQFLLATDLEALREHQTIDDTKTRILLPSGEPALLTAHAARDLGIATFLAARRDVVAQQLGLPRKALRTDGWIDRKPKARLIMFDRPIDARLAETRGGMIDRAVREDRVNVLCLWIDADGGDLDSATTLAALLARQNREEVMTVAYIPSQARGAAALVALACDAMVLLPDARIGGGLEDATDEQRLDLAMFLTDDLAPRTMRSPDLMMALFRDEPAVYRYRHRTSGVVRYFTEASVERLEDKDDWQRGEAVTVAGEALEIDGREAEQLDLANRVVDNFEAFKQAYGLESDPALVEPGWVDTLVRALASPGLASLVLMIGLAGMYSEVQLPGIGIGGFVAAVAFTLYFWANYLEGTATALEIVLFVVGVSFLILEVFVIPGFGIFGLGGGALVLASIVLASQTFVVPGSETQVRELRDSLMVVGGALVGLVGFAMVARRYLPQTPYLNKILLPPAGSSEEMAERDAQVDYRHLLDQTGTTTTQLTPSGKARIGETLVDVISEGDLIPLGSEVEVIEVHGNRVIVRATANE